MTSSFSGFWVWQMKRQPRELATTIIEIYVLILGEGFKVYLSLQKVRMSFSIYEVKICFLLYNLLYQFFQFTVFRIHF